MIFRKAATEILWVHSLLSGTIKILKIDHIKEFGLAKMHALIAINIYSLTVTGIKVIDRPWID